MLSDRICEDCGNERTYEHEFQWSGVTREEWGEHVQNQIKGDVSYSQRYLFIRAHANSLSNKYGVSSLYPFPTNAQVPKEAEEELDLWLIMLRRAHDRLLMRGGSLADDPPKGSEVALLYARINESTLAKHHQLEFAKRVERYIMCAEKRQERFFTT